MNVIASNIYVSPFYYRLKHHFRGSIKITAQQRRGDKYPFIKHSDYMKARGGLIKPEEGIIGIKNIPCLSFIH